MAVVIWVSLQLWSSLLTVLNMYVQGYCQRL